MSRAIDGTVLTDWISGECKSPSCPTNESAFGMRIMKHIERMPTIEPERKKGKWIKISPAGIYECSECGQNVMTSDIDVYRWCHGCGAKMEEPEDIPIEYFESGGI